MGTIWEENSPASLLDLAARHCVTNLQTFNQVTFYPAGPVNKNYLFFRSRAEATMSFCRLRLERNSTR